MEAADGVQGNLFQETRPSLFIIPFTFLKQKTFSVLHENSKCPALWRIGMPVHACFVRGCLVPSQHPSCNRGCKA